MDGHSTAKFEKIIKRKGKLTGKPIDKFRKNDIWATLGHNNISTKNLCMTNTYPVKTHGVLDKM